MPISEPRSSTSLEMDSPAQRPARGLIRNLSESSAVRFLLVGGMSFALDMGLLVLLHEIVGVDLWIATPVAFMVSLVFNFLLQRIFTFRASNNGGVSALKYIVLVVVNVLFSDLVVTSFDALGWSYMMGKVTATVLTTTWNYFLYRHWIFKRDDSFEKLGH